MRIVLFNGLNTSDIKNTIDNANNVLCIHEGQLIQSNIGTNGNDLSFVHTFHPRPFAINQKIANTCSSNIAFYLLVCKVVCCGMSLSFFIKGHS